MTLNLLRKSTAIKLQMDSSINRVKNTLSMMATLALFYGGPVISCFLCAMLLASRWWPLLCVYLIWMYSDRLTPHGRGRRLNWVRNVGIYKGFQEYFPQRLIKTADLPSSENYLLCIFPHGILCTGALGHFGADSSDFSKLFPGLNVTLHTLNSNFYYPFSRDYLMAQGFLTASKEALLHQLNKPGGQAPCLVVGGSAEAMLSQPGSHRVVLKDRKGFIKLALTTGTNLVPLYSFGETDLYDQVMFSEKSYARKIQQLIRRVSGIAPVLVSGAGFFQNQFGILPRRTPVTTVGRPIKVPKVGNPTKEDINKWHAKFVEELISLFDEYKYKYVANPEGTHLSVEC